MVKVAGLQMPPALQSAPLPETTYDCKLLKHLQLQARPHQPWSAACLPLDPALPDGAAVMHTTSCLCIVVWTSAPVQPAPSSGAAFIFLHRGLCNSSHLVLLTRLACRTQALMTAVFWGPARALHAALLCCASPNLISESEAKLRSGGDALMLPCRMACCAGH